MIVDSWSQDSRATRTIFRRNTGQSRLKTLGHHDNFHDNRLKKAQYQQYDINGIEYVNDVASQYADDIGNVND